MADNIETVAAKIAVRELEKSANRELLAEAIAERALKSFSGLEQEEVREVRYLPTLNTTTTHLIEDEGWFELPDPDGDTTQLRSDLRDMEDRLRRTNRIITGPNAVLSEIASIVEPCSALLEPINDDEHRIA